MEEKEAFENNKVLLWGEKKASLKLLKIYDIGNKNPRSVPRKAKDEEAKPKKVKKRVFNENEVYVKKDLQFLKDELERVEEEQENAGDDDIDDLLDLMDKIEDAIEKVEKQTEGTGFKKGSPEAFVWAQKMKDARDAKKALLAPQKAVKAKEDAKKKEKKEFVSRKKGKPWFFIGDIPKGYREATMDEAIESKKVSEYGKHLVDNNRWILNRDYDILLIHTKKPNELKWTMSGLEKRIMKSLKELEIIKGRIDSGKYSKEEGKNKLDNETYYNKKLIAGFNWYLKLIAHMSDKPYEKRKFEIPKAKAVKTEKGRVEYKPLVVIDPRTGKPAKKKLKDRFVSFMRGDDIININEKYFEGGIIKSNYVMKLFDKKIILDKDYYNYDDYIKISYIKI